MSITDALINSAISINSMDSTENDVTDAFNVIWDELKKYPECEKYLYHGVIYLGDVCDSDIGSNTEEMLQIYDKVFSIASSNISSAITISENMYTNKNLLYEDDSIVYKKILLRAHTVNGININKIIEDFKDNDVAWKSIVAVIYPYNLILVKPGEIKGLHIIAS